MEVNHSLSGLRNGSLLACYDKFSGFPLGDRVLALFLLLSISLPAFLNDHQSIKPVFYVFFILPAIFSLLFRVINLKALFSQNPKLFWLIFSFLYWSVVALGSGYIDDMLMHLRRSSILLAFVLGVAYLTRLHRASGFIDVSIFIVAVGAVFQLAFAFLYLDMPYDFRLGSNSIFGGSIHAAHYFGFFMCLGVGRFLQATSSFRWLYLLASMACLVYVVMAHSRGPYLAFLGASVMLVSLRYVYFRWFLLLFIVLAGLSYFFPEFWASRGASYRPEIWLASIGLIKENFLFGVGYGGSLGLVMADGTMIGHAHNLYLDIFARSGIGGFMLVLLAAGFVFYRLLLRRDEEMPFIFALIFFLLGMMTDVQRLIHTPSEVLVMFWLPFVVLLSMSDSKQEEQNMPSV